MARHIRTDGTESIVSPADGKEYTLEELQGYVGGTIQMVPFPDGRILVANDNGRLEGLPLNEQATTIWKEQYPADKYPHNNTDAIVGDVLVGTREEFGYDS